MAYLRLPTPQQSCCRRIDGDATQGSHAANEAKTQPPFCSELPLRIYHAFRATKLRNRNALTTGQLPFRNAQNATRTRFACILKQAENPCRSASRGLWPHRANQQIFAESTFAE